MRRLLIGLLCVALAGCGEASHAPEAMSVREAKEAPAAGQAAADGGEGGDAGVAVQLPQIAYSYRYGFEVASSAMAGLQDAHVAQCDKLGVARCRMVSMERSAGDAGAARGSLSLQVDARIARDFGARLSSAAAGAGGRLVDSSTTSEDLSKQIVDTEARLRSKEALVARLMQLLQTRNGTVAELVEAERKVAEVQQEIDSARSWLAEMRGRVSMSAVDIDYSASDGGGSFTRPIRKAFTSLGELLGTSIGALMLFVVGALPWLLVVAAIVWAIRRFLRWRRRPRVPVAVDESEAAAS